MEQYLEKLKSIQQSILSFIDDDNDSHNLFKLLSDYKSQSYYQQDCRVLFKFILQISNHHHRTTNFFDKIEQILAFFKDDIQAFFTNFQIFDLFKDNKKILSQLIQMNILKYDSDIENLLLKNDEFKSNFYDSYLDQRIGKIFETENIGNICKIIRNDSLNEFINIVNTSEIKEIKKSETETNTLLLKKDSVTFIEYAAFYGSIQIFKYLCKSNAEIEPSIWIYAIHGRNSEIIHILEDLNIKPEDETFSECLKEAIKCHHNEIAEYIQNNFLSSDSNINTVCLGIKYYNFALIDDENLIKKNSSFCIFGEYLYYHCVDLLANDPGIDINYLHKI